MSEYTKGPWFARGDGYQAWTFDGGFNGRIMSADEQIIYAGPSSFKSLRGMTEKEALANAHLIAAAPELYEALKACMIKLEGYATDDETANMEGSGCYTQPRQMIKAAMTMAEQAINKADGKP